MPTRELAELTWEEMRDLVGARPLAVLPVGAIEAHGPHLPLATDVIIAEAMARTGGDALRSGACHAGRFETSIVLAMRPDLVREEIRRALPPNPASLSTAIREGRVTFEEAGGPRAYFGWPADATAAEGRSSIETLGG